MSEHWDQADDESRNPHDALFKGIFVDPAQAALLVRLSLPIDPGQVDLSLLEARPGEHIDPDLKERRSDLVFELSLPGDGPALRLVFEHQSAPERDVLYLAHAYLERLWDRWCRAGGSRTALPPCVVTVLFQGPGPWTGPKRLSEQVILPPGELGELLAAHQPDLVLRFVELGLLTYAELRALEGPALGILALMLLKAGPSRDLRPAWAAAGELVLQARRASLAGYQLLVRYTVRVGNEEHMARLQDDLLQAHGPEAVEPFVSAAQAWHAEGRAEGHAEGHAEGRVEEARAFLVELLTTKFGPLPPDVLERVSSASVEEARLWFRRALSATTLAEVFSG